ncbi:MAG: hypothetical protein EZS28_036987, partial [Streblomastix strix]
NLFTFGSPETQKLIQNSISLSTIHLLTDNYENKTKYLIGCKADPELIIQLMRIRRVVENKDGRTLVELVKNGLMSAMNKMMEKPIGYEDGEDMLEIVLEILRQQFWGNQDISNEIFNRTDFFDRYIDLYKILAFNKVNNELLSTLHFLTSDSRPTDQKKKLFEKGIIPGMIRFLDSQNMLVQIKVMDIIANVIIAGSKDLKEREQHPFRKPLNDNEMIKKLITLFSDKSKKKIHKKIVQVIAVLYKAYPLPEDISEDLVEQLKSYNNFDEMVLLAECPDNHSAILANNFEKILFSQFTLSRMVDYFNITNMILKYGQIVNKMKIIIFRKKKIEEFLNEQYMDYYNFYFNWTEVGKEYIKELAQETLIKMQKIIERESNYTKIDAAIIRKMQKEFESYEEEDEFDDEDFN